MKRPVPPVIIRHPEDGLVVHSHPLVNRILLNRGVKRPEEMEYHFSDILPADMLGMDQAVQTICKHIMADSRILILGDYDCDGATATSIAMEGLSLLGAQHVDFLIPDRGIHGYGLTPAIVSLAEEKSPDLIVTVDNGTASFAGAEAVKTMSRPCELVITDHHLPADGGLLPEAAAIVNPNQPNCHFASKNIAGCGVMFYVIIALREHMIKEGIFEARGELPPSLDGMIDLVALGTVADVVPLDRNNRILVSTGLERINAGHGRPGINALLSVAKREVGFVSAQDFGFGVGPRLNAAGRLDDMSTGIRCLLAQDPIEAAEIAEALDELNQTRRSIEADMTEEAIKVASEYQADGSDGVVLYNPTWHEGVVGIVASRIKEQVNRPVICFTDTHEARALAAEIDRATSSVERTKAESAYADREIKGSCRSVPGVHLKHALDRIHKRHPEVLTKFGGHAMAAGVTLRASKLEDFRSLFAKEVGRDLTDEIRAGLIEIDAEGLAGDDQTIETAKLIASLGPWGQKFPEPIFKGRFIVEDVRVMKDIHLKVRLRRPDSDELMEAVAFSVIEDGDDLETMKEVELVYRMDINRFRGRESLQLMIQHITPIGAAELEQGKTAEQEAPENVAPRSQARRTRPAIAIPF